MLSRVTCVEDDADIRDIIAIALSSFGRIEVDLCTSGSEAIARSAQFSPDLILLDVEMSDMNGEETYTRLRGIPALEDTPIVFMTARAMTGEIARLQRMGAADVITKPFDPLTLAERLDVICKRNAEAAEMRSRLRDLLVRHCSGLARQADEIGRLLAEGLAPDCSTREPLIKARTITHQAKGTSGSVGFPDMAKAATALDDLLHVLSTQAGAIAPSDVENANALFDQFKAMSEACTPDRSTLYNANLPRRP